jgi:hypothetical protein
MEETQKNGLPSDKSETLCAVLTGDLYQILIKVRADSSTVHMNAVYAGLDTCGGCNLIRKNQLPPNADIRPLSRGPRIAAAQGQALKTLGVVTLYLRLDGSPISAYIHANGRLTPNVIFLLPFMLIRGERPLVEPFSNVF